MYEWYQEKLAGEWFIWDNSERKFYKVHSKKLEDAVDLLNNQKATIDALRKDNNDLRELNGKVDMKHHSHFVSLKIW